MFHLPQQIPWLNHKSKVWAGKYTLTQKGGGGICMAQSVFHIHGICSQQIESTANFNIKDLSIRRCWCLWGPGTNLHRYLGMPLLQFIMAALFNTPFSVQWLLVIKWFNSNNYESIIIITTYNNNFFFEVILMYIDKIFPWPNFSQVPEPSSQQSTSVHLLVKSSFIK